MGGPAEKEKPSSSGIAVHAAFFAMAAFAAWYYAYLRWGLTGQPVDFPLVEMARGGGGGRFELVPWLVGLASGVGPLASVEHLPFKLYRLAEFLSAFLLVVCFRYYLSLFINSAALTSVLAFSVLYPMVFNYIVPADLSVEFPLTMPSVMFFKDRFNLYYPYDTPAVMFFTLGLILLYRRKWVMYYALFAVATLNREAAGFLMLVYLLTAWGRDSKRAIALHAGAQILIWVAVRWAVYPGGPDVAGAFQSGVSHAVRVLMDPSNYYYVLSNMGYAWVPVAIYWRRIGDGFVRRSLLVALPFVAVVALFGRLDGLRGFGELIPVMMGAAVLAVKGLLSEGGSQAPSGAGAVKEGLAQRLREKVLPHAVFLLVAAVASVYYAHLRWALNGQFTSSPLLELARGEANVPFQFRALVPWLVGRLSDLPLPMSPMYREYRLYYAFEVLSFFGLLVAFRWYISHFIKNAAASSVLSFLLLYSLAFDFILPFNFPVVYPFTLPTMAYVPEYFDHFNLFYPYDTPSMMFFTIGLALIYRRKWLPYYVLFAVATWNREMTCFLTLVYLFTAWGRDRRGVMALHTAAQFLIWVAIKWALYLAYGTASGSLLAFISGVAHNVGTLLDPSTYYYTLSNMGYVWVPVVLCWRRIGDGFLKRSLLVAFPFLVGVFVAAKFTELRDFGEMIPVVLAAFLAVIAEMFRAEGAAPRAPGRV